MMNILRLLFPLILLPLISCTTTGMSGLKLPGYSDIRLKSGLKLLVIKDRSLPYFSIGAIAGAGSRNDPTSKSGLSYLTASLLERGTRQMSAPQLAEAFASFGTKFSFSVDQDYGFFSTQGLSEHQSELINLFFQVLREPSFVVPELNRRKTETIASIRRGYDNPSFVAGRALSQFLYGIHPYARAVSGTPRDIESIRQKDVIRFYLQHYRPSQFSIVLVGDVNDATIDQIKKLTESWEDRSGDAKPEFPAPVNKGSQVLLVHKNDLKQSEVRLGHIGITRNNPDYLALDVATTILSGGFNSRLMKEIRVKRGLTYGMRADFDGRLDPGPFLMSAATRHEKVGELVTESIKVYKDMFENGITEKELTEAQGFMSGRFAMSVETPSDVARSLLLLRFYGIEDSYLTNYIKNLNALDVDDVNSAIRKYFNPGRMQIVVYGPRNKVIEQLRPLGAVEVRGFREIY